MKASRGPKDRFGFIDRVLSVIARGLKNSFPRNSQK